MFILTHRPITDDNPTRKAFALGLSLTRSGLPNHELIEAWCPFLGGGSRCIERLGSDDAKKVGLDEVSALLPHLPPVPIRSSLVAEDVTHHEETRRVSQGWKAGLQNARGVASLLGFPGFEFP